MTALIHDDFMLNTEAAKRLYHEYAKEMPIFDFHCHLSPEEIATDKKFESISEIWLHGDHYKWRAMRTLGVKEELITGEASDREKFKAWAKVVPYTIGNPLFHWTHLELKRYFGINRLLTEETSDDIWEQLNEMLQTPEFSSQKIIEKSNVKAICTTDDPIDTLKFHESIDDNKSFQTKVLPTFRPDKIVNVESESFIHYIHKLGATEEVTITSYKDLLKVIETKAHYFNKRGCCVSDHGLNIFPFSMCTYDEASAIFKKLILGEKVSRIEVDKYKTYTLVFLGKLYHSLGWVMQLHLGAIRSNNDRMFKRVGPDTGFDSIHDYQLASSLNGYLNELDKEDQLPKTIIYNLNPSQNYVVATTIGNFQREGVKGKIQFGSGWWFNDHKDGMVRQMTDLSNVGIFSSFIGMLTDSRSLLSFTRHEYFRRILCDYVGGWIDRGEAPAEYEFLGSIIKDICYNNAENYFEI
ncbi:glucuronate isomerase [Alteribacter populi]|uniref:glucuronate isomerase n=1 Tax=Alteribacter populi TaxID=2011011 RepID=UPI000BBA80B7|nr:glucuronate isomerase [Alteribacter populi]